MTTVVDASVVVAALADSGPEGSWAESMIAEGSLVGPELVLVESCNVLRRLVLSGQLSIAEATVAHGSLLRLDIDLFPFAPFSDRVWALRNNLTSYDAWYIAMAEYFDCPLVTLDWKLSRVSGLRCDVVSPNTSAEF